MSCKKCNSARMANISAKCSDLCFVQMNDKEHDGYVPEDMGIGGDDYVDFSFCLNCGTIEGDFPLPPCELEDNEEEDKD